MRRTFDSAIRRLRVMVPVLGVTLACWGCGGGPAGTGGVDRVVIVNSDLSLAVGAQDSLVAYAIDRNGSNVATTIDWRTTAPLIATVSATGRVTAMAPGTALIIASTSGKADTLRLTVQGDNTGPPSVQVVVIAGTDLLLPVATTDSIRAIAIGAGGVAVTTPIAFRSSNEAVATITSTGRITTITPGTAQMIASASGKADTMLVTVYGPLEIITVRIGRSSVKTSDTTRAFATGTDAGGRPVPITPEWASDDTTSAVIAPNGLILGLRSNNNVLITATVGTRVGFVNLSVIPAAVKSVRITPATATVGLAATIPYQLEVLDEFDVPITDRPVLWSSSNPAAVSVTQAGLALGVSAGTATITASLEGKSGTSVVTVLPIPQNVYQLEVNNLLLASVIVYVNDVQIGILPEQSQGAFQLQKTPTAVVRYAVIPAKAGTAGEPLTETLPTVTAPDGVVSVDIDNIINGKTYFTPLLRSLVAPKIDVEMSERDLAGPCGCSIAQEEPDRRFGYWPFRAGASVILIRQNNPAFTIVLPVLGNALETGTGIWRATVLTAP